MPREHAGHEVRLQRAEVALWVVACLCALLCCFYLLEGATSLLAARLNFPRLPSHVQMAETADRSRSEQGDVIGWLDIPALRLSVPMITGVEPMSLTRGVGHITGTALPGGLGTVGLAGHRDTYLRTLRRVTVGMDVELIDRTGVYHYTVERMEIVTPDQVSVLDIQATPKLTLITCYPFDYVGPAPRRFVVYATLDSVAPDGRS